MSFYLLSNQQFDSKEKGNVFCSLTTIEVLSLSGRHQALFIFSDEETNPNEFTQVHDLLNNKKEYFEPMFEVMFESGRFFYFSVKAKAIYKTSSHAASDNILGIISQTVCTSINKPFQVEYI